jgi:O-antigen/teichoic acid export membrane protein
MVFFSHLEAIQQSHLDFKGGFAGHFVRQSFFFLVILSYKLTKVPLTLTALAMYQSISIALGAIVLFIFSRQYLLFRFNASKYWIKNIFNYGGYIFGSGIVANVYVNLDQIMTAKFMAPSNVAYYNVASRINSLVDIPSYAAAEVLFPKASRASVEEGKEKVKYLFEKMVAVLMAFTIPTAIFIIIFPRLLTVIIAGPIYAAAAPILQLYMVGGILRPTQNQAANLLNSIGKSRLVFIMNTATLLTMLVTNYICLIQFGFYGIAIGSLIATMLSFIAWYFVMRKEINLEPSKIISYTIGTYKSLYMQIVKVLKKK